MTPILYDPVTRRSYIPGPFGAKLPVPTATAAPKPPAPTLPNVPGSSAASPINLGPQPAPYRPPVTSGNGGGAIQTPFVPAILKTDSGMPRPSLPGPSTPGVKPTPAQLFPTVTNGVLPAAPSVPVVPSPKAALATQAADALPQPNIVLPPVVSTSGGQTVPASGGGGVAADGGASPMSQPAVVGQAGMDPKLLLYAVGAAVVLTFLSSRKGRGR